MSDLYEVKALSKSPLAVSLFVRSVHPDAEYFPADPSFALMILREAAEDDARLAKEVSFNDVLDAGWVTRFCKGFITSVTVSNEKKKSATVDVMVSDEAWIEHIQLGQTWASTAFEVVDRYDEHEPITAQAPTVRSPSDDEDDMFVWVPRECFLFMGDVATLPPLMKLPAYAASAYVPTEKLTQPYEQWINTPVLSGDRAGVLGSLKGDWAQVIDFTEGARGSVGASVGSLSRLAPKAGRRGTKLAYASILRAAATTVSALSKHDNVLELTIRIPPDGRTLPFATETDAFEVLFAPSRGQGGIGQFRDSPFARAIIADLAERELEGSHRVDELRPELAKKYIASFTLSGPAHYGPPALEPMASDQARATLEAPWPTATLTIEVTDPRWISHLELASYMGIALQERPLEPPRAPKPRPVVAPEPRPDERAVLYFKDAKSDKIWVLERYGAVHKGRSGKRLSRNARPEKVTELASEEAAKKAFEKAVAKKLNEGYRPSLGTEDSTQVVLRRTGVHIEDRGGKLIVREAFEALRPKDQIPSATTPAMHSATLNVIEELALLLIPLPAGTPIYLDYMRPSTGTWTSFFLRLR